jgi:hypothetical protein
MVAKPKANFAESRTDHDSTEEVFFPPAGSEQEIASTERQNQLSHICVRALSKIPWLLGVALNFD